MKTLRERTKAFAVDIIRFCVSLPPSDEARVIRRQLLRSGTSPGAHCREAFRSRSDAEMISKLETALQELDESMYWMELLAETGIARAEHVAPLMQAADEIISIAVASVRTIKRRRR